MNEEHKVGNLNRQLCQALGLWGVFIVSAMIINGTIPFALGADMHVWTFSKMQNFLSGLIVYGFIFLAAPLVLIKGWQTVRKPAFLLPLLLAILAAALFNTFRGIAAIVVVVLVYLHWRYDLSDFGIRSWGWKQDMTAILVIAGLSLVPVLIQPSGSISDLGRAMISALDRMFANPASSIENLFYFGFLTERLSFKTGRYLTPLLVGLMYTGHEMTNPEYWYENVNFLLVFASVFVAASIYIWRRSVIVIWVGDGLARFVRVLLG